MNISTINQIKYYAPTFSGIHGTEREEYSNARGILCHLSSFFRYPDEFNTLKEKIVENFPNEKLHIVSAGCSYGEEVYTLAMLLDDLKITPEITGVDLSDIATEEAKKGRYLLSWDEKFEIFSKTDKTSENNRRMFEEYFEKKDLEADISKKYIKPEYYIKKDEKFKNCNFKQGDITQLSKMFEENSVNAITCNNVIYHLISDNASDEEIKNIYKKIFSEFSKVLKPKGLLCFTCIEKQIANKAMEEIGEYELIDSKNGIMVWQKKEQK